MIHSVYLKVEVNRCMTFVIHIHFQNASRVRGYERVNGSYNGSDLINQSLCAGTKPGGQQSYSVKSRRHSGTMLPKQHAALIELPASCEV